MGRDFRVPPHRRYRARVVDVVEGVEAVEAVEVVEAVEARQADGMHDVEFPLPDGYERFIASPFLDLVGPLYVDWSTIPAAATFLFPVRAEHANMAGLTHGGLLMALVDITGGQGSKRIVEGFPRLVTVSSSVDFLSAVEIGETLEIEVSIDRSTKTLVFSAIRIHVGDRPVARASTVFQRR